jgi:tRNA(His) 5'-end guanylyltransferase
MTTELTLGDRMKAYELATRTVLMNGCPKILRLDGKAFHTFTRKFKQPYDKRIMDAMVNGAISVMKEIGGVARFAYIQSDECTIVLNDSLTENSQPWYANQVQKMVSVSAAIMSVNFSYHLSDNEDHLAYFDSRVFALPYEMEMTNNVIWRQQDATRNSISQWSRSLCSHKELQGKSGPEMQDLMMSKGFNWNDAPTWTKRGVVVYKVPGVKDGERSQWLADDEIPVFTKNRDYLLNLYKPKIDIALEGTV